MFYNQGPFYFLKDQMFNILDWPFSYSEEIVIPVLKASPGSLNKPASHSPTTRIQQHVLGCIDLSAVCVSRKSTFFNVLTKSQAAAENFPFCTIDPNESRVPIPDERYDFLCQFHKPARYGGSLVADYSHSRLSWTKCRRQTIKRVHYRNLKR